MAGHRRAGRIVNTFDMGTVESTLSVVPEAAVAAAVAEFLHIEPHTIDSRTPLSAYGVDSLGAMQLVAVLEDRFCCTLPESLLTDYPDLRQLVDALGDAIAACGGRQKSSGVRDRLIADSRLDDDIAPRSTMRPPAVRRVVLTGATGFLGSSLLRTLIDAGLQVVCLVRPQHAGPGARVHSALQRYGLWRSTDASAFHAVAANLEQPNLGLASGLYDELAAMTDAVYHAAADVNWVAAYDSLRSSNVSATTSLLRFACTSRIKRFHFVSSLSVCMAYDGPSVVTEQTDMLPYVDRLPLGYAQSKCVAESLVRTAASRGLPAQIFRPALLAGHSSSGASNVDDLIAALLKGCIQSGAAPDLDWAFDAVPVDTAASAIATLSRSCGAQLETFHLRHPRPRHWRECVLWANCYGYPIRLEPYEQWLERLDRDAHSTDHALYLLRAFFTRRFHGRTAPEHYEESAHSRIECRRTRGHERLAGIDYPPLDAERLDSYLADFIRRGFVTPPPGAGSHCSIDTRRRNTAPDPIHRFESLLRRHFGDGHLRIDGAELVRRGSEHSIISEMTSWKRGQQTGLFHYRLALARGAGVESLDVMAKVKPPDEAAIEVAETTAAIVDAHLHRLIVSFRDRLGVRDGHVRELAIYQHHRDDLIGRHLPRCYGTWADDDRQEWGLLLEHLGDMALMDAQSPAAWTRRFRMAAIDGLAAIHARWLGQEAALMAQPWIGHVPSTASIVEMTPLWTALADHAAPVFETWAGRRLVETHAALATTACEWAPALEALPRTLIHNDFNSRNVALRSDPHGPRLVAYDWELAAIGAPQRDLAEFLCFALPGGVDGDVLAESIERHRTTLERHSGVALDRRVWQEGFRSALAYFLVSRLGIYAMINRIRPLAFLPHVVHTWSRLYELTFLDTARRSGPPEGGHYARRA
ncbi:MAG TPA: thioester reductase domain-containing protein [Vicinamibacterales bacterium]|nr:thioester reductase domain-containing protein [Vicinamibacterales bacterium]